MCILAHTKCYGSKYMKKYNMKKYKKRAERLFFKFGGG